jgi:TRAP-type C4-dicarboxylate transport system permease large subunit
LISAGCRYRLPPRRDGDGARGCCLFVGCAAGRVAIEQVAREIRPFYAVMFAVLMLVAYIPAISLWPSGMLSL